MILPGTTAAAAFEYGGTEPITVTYQWYLNEVPVSGAVAQQFSIPSNAGGKTIRVEVTLTNTEGIMTRRSALYQIENELG